MKHGPCVFLVFLFLVLSQSILWAALREEWEDQDNDGKKEAHLFYDANRLVKSEADSDGDGKADVFIHYKNGKRAYSEADKNHDGKMDQWFWYNPSGHLLRKAVDNNGDGKADQFTTLFKGKRDFVTKEYDRNFDGSIDRRQFSHWDPNKSIPTMNGTRMVRIPVPGYATLWKEEDNNFDGILDVYWDKKDKTKTKVGQPINPKTLPLEEGEEDEEAKKTAGQGKLGTESLVESMNKKYGYE